MNLRTDIPMTKEAFLRWVQRQEERCEFVEGKIVMMAGASRNHITVAGNLFGLLWSRIDRQSWKVAQSDFAVETTRGIRYPDVLVEPLGPAGSGYVSVAPTFVAEVLSRSSLETDLHEKADEYTALASLRAYAVLAQDEPRLWLWVRDADGQFPKGGEMIEGLDAVLKLPTLALELSLTDIYQNID